MSVTRPELLSPAGNLEKAKLAIDFGADALYLGGKQFSLRARASNFGKEEIEEIVEYANKRNAKIYIVANIICHNQDVGDKLVEYISMIKKAGVSGVIAADPYIINECIKVGLETHISTQQSITNSKAAKFWNEVGATRVVTAREVTKVELKDMIKATPEIEYEYFIHGAVCIAYSGRCTMSNHFSFRDSNKGGCSQSCRWMYDIDNDGQRFTMSAKDSSLIDEVKELMDMGVASLKIEGRMKSLHYVGTITSAYRRAIDDIAETGTYDIDDVRDNVNKAVNRLVDSNFFNGQPGHETQFYGELNTSSPRQDFVFTTITDSDDDMWCKVIVRNNFKIGQEIEVFGPDFKLLKSKILDIKDENGNHLEVAKRPMEELFIKLDASFNGKAMGRKR